jgi:hypothetical protein
MKTFKQVVVIRNTSMFPKLLWWHKPTWCTDANMKETDVIYPITRNERVKLFIELKKRGLLEYPLLLWTLYDWKVRVLC